MLAREPRHPLLIAGGGPAADLVRDWDRRHCLGEERSHRLAIRSLRLGEGLLAEGLANADVVDQLNGALRAWKAGRIPIANVEAWLDGEMLAVKRLPASWDVTSDSIAAGFARCLNADLSLLKSTNPDRAGNGFVDPAFEKYAAGLHVEWCDLRSGARGRWVAADSAAGSPHK